MPNGMRSPLRRSLPAALTLLVLSLCFAPAALATTRKVATSGADSGTCVTTACKSFGYAYQQSAPGDVVQVAGGSYGSQSIPTVSGRGAPAVVFQPAAGASVTTDEV